jgi:hypothetical protein
MAPLLLDAIRCARAASAFMSFVDAAASHVRVAARQVCADEALLLLDYVLRSLMCVGVHAA